MNVTSSSMARVLRGLRVERADLAEDAAEVDAIITSEQYDLLPRIKQLGLLRKHAALLGQINALDLRIVEAELCR